MEEESKIEKRWCWKREECEMEEKKKKRKRDGG